MPITYSHSVLRPSAHGWRLTFFDGKDPVASFWATEKQMVHQHARAALGNHQPS